MVCDGVTSSHFLHLSLSLCGYTVRVVVEMLKKYENVENYKFANPEGNTMKIKPRFQHAFLVDFHLKMSISYLSLSFTFGNNSS